MVFVVLGTKSKKSNVVHVHRRACAVKSVGNPYADSKRPARSPCLADIFSINPMRRAPKRVAASRMRTVPKVEGSKRRGNIRFSVLFHRTGTAIENYPPNVFNGPKIFVYIVSERFTRRTCARPL